MTPELEDKLLERYPEIFMDHSLPPSQTCMCWLFECGDGWYDIIDNLCAVIKNHCDPKYNSHPGPEVVAVQVKEKFGTLRFYINGGDSFIDGAISMAEHMSGRVCEECGSPGRKRDGGWIRTLCDKCAEKK